MLIAIDVGNTQTVMGLFEDEKLVDSWRLSTVRERTADEYRVAVRGCSRIWFSFTKASIALTLGPFFSCCSVKLQVSLHLFHVARSFLPCSPCRHGGRTVSSRSSMDFSRAGLAFSL